MTVLSAPSGPCLRRAVSPPGRVSAGPCLRRAPGRRLPEQSSLRAANATPANEQENTPEKRNVTEDVADRRLFSSDDRADLTGLA